MSGSNDASNDETLADGPPHKTAPRLSLPSYEIGAAIGVGGMGEVLVARDSKIGRDVAIKRMRVATPELRERFLREAKIQARLDHPAVAPVYELGEDAAGQPYFTMKRLAGTTLLEHLKASDTSPQRLLRAFVDVCRAIDFAHSRGVVHRDLKPANIMLGEFGEVYVLDWGIARLASQPASTELPSAASPSIPPDAHTSAGAMLGTPGYMAPEQARGEAVELPADVYSLGCILFEILAGTSLHPPGVDGIASTVTKPTQSPSARRPERAIAPELDVACTAALARDPTLRPTAREIGDRVQAYLDGDRDEEHRAKLAAELVVRARAAASAGQRAEAIRSAGRALALDPDSAEAASLVMTLMLEPPKELPSSLERHLDRISADDNAGSARRVVKMMVASVALLPLAAWVGVTNWPLVGSVYAVVGAIALDAHVQARRDVVKPTLPLLLGTLLLVLLSRVAGSIMFAPTLAVLFVVAVGSQPNLIDRPWLVLGCTLAALFLPVVLELVGVFARTWEISGDRIVVTSQAIRLSGTRAYVFLLGANVFFIVTMFWFTRVLAASRAEARKRLEIHAWQLQQLLPADDLSAKRDEVRQDGAA